MTPPLTPTFSTRIRDYLRTTRTRQSDLARRAGIGQPALSLLLNKHTNPRLGTLILLANAMSIHPATLLFGCGVYDLNATPDSEGSFAEAKKPLDKEVKTATVDAQANAWTANEPRP